MGCVSHSYMYLRRPTTISTLSQKALLNKHEHVMHIKNQNVIYHCISEGTLSDVILHVICLIKQRL